MGVVLTDKTYNMLMFFFVFVQFFHGFLFDNPHRNPGHWLPANQYLTISKFAEEKTLLQQKVETDTTTLRHEMDTIIVLLTTQLQQKLDIMDAKITDKEVQNKTNLALVTLQQKYQALEQNYHNLKIEKVILQGKLFVVESELVLIKNKTNINDELLEVQEEICNNTKTILMKQGQELALLKSRQLRIIKPLQHINILEEKIQTLSSQTNSLSLKERARSQEFLALCNMTTHALSDLQMRTDSKIQQLSNSHNISFRNIKNRMYRLNNNTLQSHKTSVISLESSLEIHLKNIEKNQSETLGEIAIDIQETERRTNVTLSRLQNQIDDITDLVAMNAHPALPQFKAGIIKFDDVKFSVGINNLSTFKSTGIFTCETGGLYLISASIMSYTNNAFYYIYLNGYQISYTKIAYSSSPPSTMYHTGTVVLARQLRPNDSVWVQQNYDFYIYHALLSTLTIVKVK